MQEENLRPLEIGRANQHDLKVVWPDGRTDVLPAFDLRADCWCALCVNENTGARVLDPARLPKEVHPLAVKPIGNYAIQIEWSDGHNTGLYTYQHLRELGDRAKDPLKNK